jgi:hypothetical protein
MSGSPLRFVCLLIFYSPLFSLSFTLCVSALTATLFFPGGKMSGVGARCTLNWHYRKDSWPHISDSGSADIDVSGASASVKIQVCLSY